MIEFKGVSKSYAKSNVKAVNNLTLTVEPGQVFGFLGANGAGKTTTIKMLTGILPITEGDIIVCGKSIKTDAKAAKINIGYVPDNHSVYDKLTGREYVNFMADVYGVSSQLRQERAERLLERFNLTDAFNSQIKTYSHGMKQKICIIGALIHDPNVWVLDEPLTGLDPQSAFELKSLMKEHCNKGNIVFFSTHILEVAEKICDRIAIIDKGGLIMSGSMNEIVDRQNDRSLEKVFLSITGGNNG